MAATYNLIDSATGEIICRYKAKAVALNDCERKNVAARTVPNAYRFYVLKPNGRKVVA